MPWLCLDALMLLIIWYIPYFYPPTDQVKYAWIMAATFIPISFGGAADDVSLAAYIQSSLARLSPLGTVIAFLYSSYIIIYAAANPLLEKYIDYVYNSTGTVRPVLLYTAAVQLTIIGTLVFFSTFIPKGAIAFNPQIINGQSIDHSDISEIISKQDDASDDIDLIIFFYLTRYF